MDPSIYRLRQADILAFCVLALLCLGMIMVQSAAMNVTGQAGWRWTPMGTKQFAFCFVGLAAFFVLGRFDYHRLNRPLEKWTALWKHPVVIFLAVTVVLNLLVL